MPTIQSTGIGSGLDIESLVEKLVAAERAPTEAQLTRRESKATLQISALASLKGALAALKNTLNPLKSTGTLNAHSAGSSDEEVLTASATGKAVNGSYPIEVVALAQAQQLASDPFAAGASAVVGTGTLTFTQGTESFDVVIDSSNNTLAKIRDAINSAAGNSSVQATIINEVNGSRLILTSSKTGEDQAFTVTRSGGNGGLDELVYNPGTLTNLTRRTEALDAHIRIATYDHYSPSNAVTGAIDGVTLNLKATTAAATTVSLDITSDTSTIAEGIEKFVAAYNSLNTTITGLRSYDATTRAAGPLLGDATLRGIETQLRSLLVNPVSGASNDLSTLAAIGVTRELDGSLTIDQDVLNAALESDRSGVAALLGSADGIATRLSAGIESQLSVDAGIATRNHNLQSEISRIDDDKEALEARMLLIEERYRRQFTAMDTLLASLSTTSNYLAQQLENLPKPNQN